MQELLEKIRSAGWSVGVHNDYRLNGVAMTFWMFTHPNGQWVKGEGTTDLAALQYVWDEIVYKQVLPS